MFFQLVLRFENADTFYSTSKLWWPCSMWGGGGGGGGVRAFGIKMWCDFSFSRPG